MVALPAVGSLARFDGRGNTNAEQAIAALPPRATELLDVLRVRGWRWSVEWAEDTGSNRFVTIRGVGADPLYSVNATWHTRNTGTLRLFGLIVRRPRRGWSDASVKAAVALIEENPA